MFSRRTKRYKDTYAYLLLLTVSTGFTGDVESSALSRRLDSVVGFRESAYVVGGLEMRWMESSKSPQCASRPAITDDLCLRG